jgi:eukaryotic translation initiation factor 2C
MESSRSSFVFLLRYCVRCVPLHACLLIDFPLQGERFKEPLQGAETADFIKFATSPATIRAQQITENVKKLHWHELHLLKEFGISVKPHMLQVDGRILPSPAPQYGSGTENHPVNAGRWNLLGKRFLEVVIHVFLLATLLTR